MRTRRQNNLRLLRNLDQMVAERSRPEARPGNRALLTRSRVLRTLLAWRWQVERWLASETNP